MRITIVDKIELPEGQTAGAVEFRELDGEVKGIAFRCPCGCGYDSWLPFNDESKSHGWDWNGDKTNPSLTPSVLQSGLPCKWHGFLTDGNWNEC